MNLKPGDRVRMKVGSRYYLGEVTIVREEDKMCKVLFDYMNDQQPDYWYYPEKDLEKCEPVVYDYRFQD